jgi:hypothetical protein
MVLFGYVALPRLLVPALCARFGTALRCRIWRGKTRMQAAEAG